MDTEKIISELKFKAVRSSGAGGQNVNKVSSKIVLSFDLGNSKGLSVEEIAILEEKMASRLTNDKILILNSDEDRSQLKNKETAIKRLLLLLQQNLIVPKERKATKVPKAVIKKRIQSKRKLSEKKESRRKPDF
ncbi:ribosome-associated protein [Flavobacterium sp. 28YEA47A]|uniref:alternative ribosome rescue aminoacyl-tRNA hydrolase ArfB n=1 Tax=Flavobacterium sp. 28YEA47A TaxID=3156276 RepID=UPI0035125AB6